MVGAGHAVFHAVGAAGFGNALIIGGDKHIIELFALFGFLVHPPDHGLAQNIRQRLARHPRAGITGGNNADKFHSKQPPKRSIGSPLRGAVRAAD